MTSNPYRTALLGIAIGAITIGVIVTFSTADALGISLISTGILALVAWLAVSAIRWVAPVPDPAQQRPTVKRAPAPEGSDLERVRRELGE